MKKKQALRELAIRHRPREKAQKLGFKALSNSELLAIIIGSGLKNCNVLELAKKVEKKILSSENGNKIKSLTSISGIGEILASKILASLEFGQRFAQSKKQVFISSPEKIYQLSMDLAHKKQEHCLAFYFNGRQELLGKRTISIGGLNFNYLEPRDIFEPAFSLGASSFILVHNHPSGNVKPSENDLLLTKKLAQTSELMGLKLLDHLVIAKNKFFSIGEHYDELLRT